MTDALNPTTGFAEEHKEQKSDSDSVSSDVLSSPSSFFLDDFDCIEAEISDEECDSGLIRNGVSGDHHSPDALLAYELNQLSLEERGLLDNDIHGIQPRPLEETPDFLREKIDQLSVKLDSMPERDKSAYKVSQAFPKTYVNTKEFRLMFLRCEQFDVQKAATRLLLFLDTIRESFGDVVLERRIRFSDLDEPAAETVSKGMLQMLPGRDRSGRRVAGNFPFVIQGCGIPASSRIQAALYIITSIARENVDVQRDGIVGLFWVLDYNIVIRDFNDIIDDFKTRSLVHGTLINCIPVRFVSLHMCLPNTSEMLQERLCQIAKAMYIYAIGPENRKRLRVHFGSPVECLYALQTFGIASHGIPINTNTGKIKLHQHHQWLEVQRQKDKAYQKNESFPGIECPAQNDILFGRGWPKMSHPGNAIFRNLIETRLEEYNSARSKKDKTMIGLSIVCELKESGARFLKQGEHGLWLEVSSNEARQKVSIGFRDVRKAKIKSAKLAAAAGDAERNCPSSTVKRKSHQTDPTNPTEKNNNPRSQTKTHPMQYDEGSFAFVQMDGSKRMRCGPCKDE